MRQIHLHFREEQDLANETISEGDYVLIYLDARRTYMIKMRSGKNLPHTQRLPKTRRTHRQTIRRTHQKQPGHKLHHAKTALTDYIMKSSRNTQITYPKDAALIVMFSGIGPGSRVVESGTGTGALTTALAHYVGDTGKVYTYELRSEFQKNAAKKPPTLKTHRPR